MSGRPAGAGGARSAPPARRSYEQALQRAFAAFAQTTRLTNGGGNATAALGSGNCAAAIVFLTGDVAASGALLCVCVLAP